MTLSLTGRVANNDLDPPSMIENANAKPLNRAMIGWFFTHYLRSQAESNNQMISLSPALTSTPFCEAFVSGHGRPA